MTLTERAPLLIGHYVRKNLSNVLLESLDNLVDWRKFSLHIINECINFSNHLANYLAIPSETESVITL